MTTRRLTLQSVYIVLVQNSLRGREDLGASRTHLPEIGFTLGSATAR